jgi:hypothetical protein
MRHIHKPMVFSVFLNFWMFLLTAFDSNLTFFTPFSEDHFSTMVYGFWQFLKNGCMNKHWHCCLCLSETSLGDMQTWHPPSRCHNQRNTVACWDTGLINCRAPSLWLLSNYYCSCRFGTLTQQQQAVMPYGSIQLCRYGRGRWIIHAD